MVTSCLLCQRLDAVVQFLPWNMWQLPPVIQRAKALRNQTTKRAAAFLIWLSSRFIKVTQFTKLSTLHHSLLVSQQAVVTLGYDAGFFKGLCFYRGEAGNDDMDVHTSTSGACESTCYCSTTQQTAKQSRQLYRKHSPHSHPPPQGN